MCGMMFETHKLILIGIRTITHYIINTNGMRIGIYQCEYDECELLLSSLMRFDAMRIIVD